MIITPSESILIYSWIITSFQKHACFKQFVWACHNIFASFFALDVLFRTCSFICLRLFCHNRSFSPFEVFQFYARTSHPLKKVRLEKSGSLYLGPLLHPSGWVKAEISMKERCFWRITVPNERVTFWEVCLGCLKNCVSQAFLTSSFSKTFSPCFCAMKERVAWTAASQPRGVPTPSWEGWRNSHSLEM